jgi:RNA ligase
MNYQFPFISHISDVLPAIEGRNEFSVAVKEGYTVINYNVMMSDTFPDVLVDPSWQDQDSGWTVDYDYKAAIRRECRGIIFDSATGDIIRRPFHKFFNVNEREETQEYVVDLSRPHTILEKLDGSMISPFTVNGDMIWGTKMGATDVAKPVEEFVKNNPQYDKFARVCMEDEVWVPIFEWCSRKQRIVLDYKEDQLVLTAMRHLNTGAYASYGQLINAGGLYNIPVVRAFEPQTDMKAFIEYTRGLEDLEGFVVRFDDGHMLKLKCHWYIQIHKAKEAILQDRNIVELILDERLDDIKAHLPIEDRDRLDQFEDDFNKSVVGIVQTIVEAHVHLKISGMDRKTFALSEANKFDKFVRPILFSIFDDDYMPNLYPMVRNMIRNNLTKTVKYEAIRDVWFRGVVFNG